MMARLWTGAAAVLLLGAAPPPASHVIKVGQPLPDVELVLIDGTKIRTADLRGRVVVLNFWATWCVPCRTELPLLDQYYRRLKDKGLSIYAITTEGSLPLSRLRPLFAAMAIPSVRYVHGMSTTMKAVPTNFVVDKAGIVRNTKAGAFDLDDLNTTLIPLLNERYPT